MFEEEIKREVYGVLKLMDSYLSDIDGDDGLSMRENLLHNRILDLINKIEGDQNDHTTTTGD